TIAPLTPSAPESPGGDSVHGDAHARQHSHRGRARPQSRWQDDALRIAAPRRRRDTTTRLHGPGHLDPRRRPRGAPPLHQHHRCDRHCDWESVRVTLIDTPGFPDFAGEVVQALAAAEAAVLVVAATGNVAVGAELAWERISGQRVPALIVVNKMDKENAAYEATVDAVRETLGRKAIATAVPIGSAEQFTGYVDLVDDRAYSFDEKGRAKEIPLPESMREEVERAH